MLCMFSSPNIEIASIKVTSKFHEKDRVVSSSLTLPTKCPADGIGIHTGLRDQVFRVRLPGGVLKPIISLNIISNWAFDRYGICAGLKIRLREIVTPGAHK